MKKFFVKALLFAILAGGTLWAIFSRANGYTDPYYLRFTSPRQTSLILGTSRAAQGLQPQVINQVLDRTDIYNYAFTLGHSPYGPAYLESIKKKVKKGAQPGVFILTVDPWSISAKGSQPNNIDSFGELSTSMAETKFVNLNPNVFYLLNSYDKPIYQLLLPPTNKALLVQPDGWLQVSLKMDSAIVAKRLQSKLNDYKNNHAPYYRFSEARFSYFAQTIDYLKDYGKVYLVRLPVHPLMMELDSAQVPQFDSLIEKLSNQKQVPYLNLSKANHLYEYTDGNHLSQKAGKEVSAEIARWIKQQ